MKLVGSCVSDPVTVIVGVILVSLFGTLALLRIPIQLTPDVDVPKVTIETQWRGRSPQEIESEITYEQERFLKNVEGVVKMTSESRDGSAAVTLEFRQSMDMNEALVKVQNALSQVPDYPDDADEPVVSTSGLQDNAIAWFVIKDKLGRKDYDVEKLRDFLENEVRPAFERVKGVARSNVVGGRERELQVIVDPVLLAANDLSLLDVREALAQDNTNVSGGDFDEGKRRPVVRVVGEFTDEEDVRQVVLASRGGVPVRIQDVAEVVLGHKKRQFFVRNKGESALAMNAIREVGSNVLEVIRGLKDVAARLNAGILDDMGIYLEQVYDEAEYVEQAIERVRTNILFGAILAAAVLLVFLRSVSSTLIVAVAIPICAVGTFLVVTLLGRTINVVMLAGISFAVGMVVDNAIVVLENIHRRRAGGADRRTAAIEGTSEVFGAVVASTLTTLAIFLPVIFNEGEVAQLFRDIAIAISAGVALSLIVSVTVIPTFAARVPRPAARRGGAGRPGLVDRVAGRIAAIVAFLNRRWSTRLATILLLTGFSLGLTAALLPDAEYLPTGNRNLVFGILLPPPGYNLDELTAMGRQIEDELLPLCDIDDDGTGTPAIRNFFYVASGRNVFLGVSAKRPERARELIGVIQGPLSQVPGLFAFVSQSSLFGRGLSEGRTIDIDITGSDLPRLIAIGGRIFGTCRSVFPPETQIRPVPSLDLGNPEVRLLPRRYRMRELDLRNRDLGFLVDVFVDGAKVSDFRIGGEEIDLTVMAAANGGLESEDLEGLPIVADASRPVTVGDVASVVHTQGPEQINHIERDRVITIQVSPPRDLPLERAMRTIREDVLGPIYDDGSAAGTRIELTGTADKLSQTKDSMKWNFALAVLITYLLLAALFSSFIHPFVILLSVPLAWVGGVLGLAFTNRYIAGQNLDVLTMLGFIILIGVVVNNAILIVHQALRHQRVDGLDSADAVAEAVRNRTRPIAMSVLTSVLGMLPLVVAPGAGSELYRGLGAVVIGGLLLSALFTLFLIPTMFTVVSDLRAGVRRMLGRSEEASS